jgi:hypothetical protein
MAAVVDTGNSPARWAGTPATGGTIVSGSFTAPANSVLVCTVEADGATAGPPSSPESVVVSDSSGLTWTKQVERAWTETTDGGESSIHTAPAVSSTSRTITVTFTFAGGGTGRVSAKAYVVTGANIGGTFVDTVGANNEGGSATNNLTTSSLTPSANGLLFAADCEWSALGAFEASSDLTQDTTTYAGAISVCDGYKACSSGVGVTANLNANGTGVPQHKWCQIIVTEAAGAATRVPYQPWYQAAPIMGQ